ncbi:uncharacterized protein METZ01_LOCUS291389, partial [marine metagenome]
MRIPKILDRLSFGYLHNPTLPRHFPYNE